MRVILIFLLLCIGQSLNAQFTIKGKVIGADDGLGIPKASIKVKGTDQGTVTSMDGDFTLEVISKGVTLIIGFIGYKTKEVKPDFDVFNLIKIEPDCFKDFFYSPHLKLMVGWDIVNTEPGGRIEFRLPYWLNYHVITTHEYYPFNGKEHFYKADALINATPASCKMDLYFKYQFQGFQLPSEGLDVSTSIISTGWKPGETNFIFGFGFGRNQAFDQQKNIWAIQVGFEKTWYYGNRGYLPLSMTLARWNGFWDIEMATSRRIGPLETRLAFQHINGFTQLRLGVGFYLRLRKLYEVEKERRKATREKRRNDRINSRGT